MTDGTETGGDLGATESAVDTGADDSSAVSDAAGESAAASSGETAAEKQERLRLKWLDREEEVDDPRKLAERFSDDYEFEFKGPGGKPLKQRWPDIERAVQLHTGAERAMGRYNEQRRALEQRIERGRANNHEQLLDVVEEMFGLEDAMPWIEKVYVQHYQQQAQLAELAGKISQDPTNPQLTWQYNQQLQAMAQARAQRQNKWRAEQQAQAEKQREAMAQGQRYDQDLRGHLKAAGVPVNDHTVARAYWLKRKHQEQMGEDVPLEPRQIAARLRQEIDGEIRGQLSSMPAEKLLPFLGDKLRAVLREAELAATKAARKQQQAAPTTSSAGNGTSGGKMSAIDQAIRNVMRGS